MPALDVLAQVVHVVLGLPEHDGEHELARSGRVKRECREVEIGDGPRVDEMDDAPPVKGIAGQAIRVPCENARCFALLDADKHAVKDRPPRHLGRLFLDEGVHNCKPLGAGQVAEFRDLVTDLSASVMIQNLTPFLSMYAENNRPPCVRARSLARLSSASNSPQSPYAWRPSETRTDSAESASSAPGVMTVSPNGNFAMRTPPPCAQQHPTRVLQRAVLHSMNSSAPSKAGAGGRSQRRLCRA